MSLTELDLRRNEVLRACGVLEGAPKPFFEELVELAAHVCGTPIGLLTLVVGDRLRFHACHGIEAEGTAREGSLCGTTLIHDGPLVLEDASRDPRFATDPLVEGPPHVRCYAGAPLELPDGMRLGSLCVVDQRPHEIDPRAIERLGVLAQAAVTQLELDRMRRTIELRTEPLCVCAWCRNVAVKDGAPEGVQWMPMETFLERDQVITHGICPSCARAARTDVSGRNA